MVVDDIQEHGIIIGWVMSTFDIDYAAAVYYIIVLAIVMGVITAAAWQIK